MVLAVHPSHRFAGLDQVAAERLDGEAFVGFDPALPIRRAIDGFLRKHGARVRMAHEFDNIETIKRAVEVPSGVAILPSPTLVGEVKAGTLKRRPVRRPPPRRDLWRSSAAGPPSRWAWRRRGFSEILKADAEGSGGGLETGRCVRLIRGDRIDSRASAEFDSRGRGRGVDEPLMMIQGIGNRRRRKGLYDPSNGNMTPAAWASSPTPKGRKSHKIVRDGIIALETYGSPRRLRLGGQHRRRRRPPDPGPRPLLARGPSWPSNAGPLASPSPAPANTASARSSPRPTPSSRPSACALFERIVAEERQESSSAGGSSETDNSAAGAGGPRRRARRSTTPSSAEDPGSPMRTAFERKLFVIRRRFESRNREGLQAQRPQASSTSARLSSPDPGLQGDAHPLADRRPTSPPTWPTPGSPAPWPSSTRGSAPTPSRAGSWPTPTG